VRKIHKNLLTLQVVYTLLINSGNCYYTAIRLVDKLLINSYEVLKTQSAPRCLKKLSTQLTGIIVVVKIKFLKN